MGMTGLFELGLIGIVQADNIYDLMGECKYVSVSAAGEGHEDSIAHLIEHQHGMDKGVRS
ncbi:MAG: hypothetical protein ACKPKO_17980 [Candidatus Fonsibacter sp.]